MSKDKGKKSNTSQNSKDSAKQVSQEQLSLPLECKNEDHNWSGWLYQGLMGYKQTASRTCNICGEKQLLVPKSSDSATFLEACDKLIKDYINKIYRGEL